MSIAPARFPRTIRAGACAGGGIGLAAVGLVLGTSCANESSSSTPTRSLSLVALGDSLPGAEGCGCTGYVELYGTAAASAMGTAVDLTNPATNDGVDSGQLLERIRSDQSYLDALASADLISVQIGFNDWRASRSRALPRECAIVNQRAPNYRSRVLDSDHEHEQF